MKRLIAVFTAFAITASMAVLPVYADDTISDYGEIAAAAATETPEPEGKEIKTGVTYQAYEMISDYIAQRYLDDSYTAEDIMKMGLSAYLEENGDEALVAILKGAVQSLDPYSDFYTQEEYIEYNNQLNKTFYGLGINMKQDGEYVEIVGFVEENGLAQKSGFMIGDKIIKVDGINVIGSSLTEVRNLIVGELGSSVPITVLRDGQEIEITGTRTAVNNSTVSGGILEGNIGYIKIASFSGNTAAEFTEICDEFKAAGVKKLILDLRNNPGGIVKVAADIAQQLIPSGKIVDVKYRDSSMDFSYTSNLVNAPFKIVTLINKNTASSSEILASAIQDSKAGILLGENSYGKGVIQTVYSLRNGMVFKITIGQYLTRNGLEIDHVGLSPDVEVSNYTKKIDTSGYTKFDYLTPTPVGSSGNNVMAAKERLSVMGYYIGNLGNDVFNTDLEEAVREFQRDNNLVDSGVLDVPTQIKIKDVFATMETVVDIQMQEAYKRLGGNVDDLYS